MIIKKFRLPICPFCGIRVGRLEAFIVKNRSLYVCQNCGKTSEVVLRGILYKLLWVTQILSVLVFMSTFLFGSDFYLFSAGIILLIFGIFYFFSPYMIGLVKNDNLKPQNAKLSFWERIKKRNQDKKDKDKCKNKDEDKEKTEIKDDKNNESEEKQFFEDISSN